VPENEPATLAAYVSRALDRYARHPFLVNPDGTSWSYAQATQVIAQLHDTLRDANIRPGDRLALLGPNSAQWCLVYLAAITAGVVAVPILPDFPSASVHNILTMSGARAAFVASAMLDRLHGATFSELRHVFALEDFSAVEPPYNATLAGQIRARVEELREQAQRVIAEHLNRTAQTPRPEDLAAIVYTSGTTGSSKGVMLTQRNIVTDVLSAVRYVSITPADRMLSLLPLAHTYEASCGFLGPMGGGASFHYIDQKPSPKVLLAAFARVRPTIVFAVPLVIEKIYRKKVRPTIDKSFMLRTLTKVGTIRRAIYKKATASLLKAFGGSLRQMGFGGAAIAREVETFLREGGFPYFVGYGMTECAPLITGCRPRETRLGSCGYPIEGIDLRIAEADPATGIGEVEVRGPMVTQGYYRNPDATAALFTADGWMSTGDRGVLDKDGFLYLKGRSKNVFLGPAGENIYPEEIEQLLNSSPFVSESLVVERAHRLVALLVPDYDLMREELGLFDIDEDEVALRIDAAFRALLADANAQLPAFSRLTAYELRETELEKTPTSKVKRYLYA
jgi:long-chain acyl-CoA synthetase